MFSKHQQTSPGSFRSVLGPLGLDISLDQYGAREGPDGPGSSTADREISQAWRILNAVRSTHLRKLAFLGLGFLNLIGRKPFYSQRKLRE